MQHALSASSKILRRLALPGTGSISHPGSVPHQKSILYIKAHGFTLIELLVAIAILALVAILSWRGLDQILRARETVTAAMERERALAQFFDQLSADARAATADEVIGAPAVQVTQNQVHIARYFDMPDRAPRVQWIRYYRQDQRILRAASPPLSTHAALRAAAAASVGAEAGWSTVTLMQDALAFEVQAWVPEPGGRRMVTVTQLSAPFRKAVAAQGGIHPHSVAGIEIRVRVAGMRHALTRIALVGE